MNILEITEMLKRMPDADIQTLTQNPSPDVPSWALLTETNRRNRTRQGAQAGAGAPPTVAQQLTQQIGQQQPVPTQIPQPGAQSQPRGLGSMMAQGAPKGYAGGGIVAFGGGGEIRGYEDGGWVAKARRLGYKAKDEADAYAWIQQRQRQQLQLQDPYTAAIAVDPYAAGVSVPTLPDNREPISPRRPAGIGGMLPTFQSQSLSPDVRRGMAEAAQVKPTYFAPVAQQTPAQAAQDPARLKLKAQQEAAWRAAAAQQLPPVAAPTTAGLGSMSAAQIAMPEKPTPAAEVNIPARSGELAGYYGEDEYGKALAADLAERRKLAAASKEKDLGWALIEGGLAGMVAGGESGATTLGTFGKAGLKALEGQKAREAARSEEETGMRKETLGEVGRKQTEKRGYTTAALGEAKEAAKETREALSKYADRVQETTFKNAELKNAITGHLIQADTQLKSHERALDRADQQQVEADRRAMGQLVTLAQKDMAAARGTPDEAVATGVYNEVFNAYKSMLPAPGTKKGKVVADLTT